MRSVRESRHEPPSGPHLQDDVIEADQVLRSGSSFALVSSRFLQFGVQSVSHALIPLHQCAQFDVGQVTGRGRDR